MTSQKRLKESSNPDARVSLQLLGYLVLFLSDFVLMGRPSQSLTPDGLEPCLHTVVT
jgi:hypothetical protein